MRMEEDAENLGSDHWMQYYVAPQEWEDNDENAEDDEDFPQGSE